MPNSPIFTNKALTKMRSFGLSESDVLYTFNHGHKERALKPVGAYQMVNKYPGSEVGAIYDQRQDGAYIIISVWTRTKRR